ncbi:MAG: DegT/DnrJ/EryC1/StrS family aminotransferase [Dehalococcoidia bacterium]|nr:DegT/DnrJ/EryC1/StrS family aminotransferase [Dehalococcoidia bacterium]
MADEPAPALAIEGGAPLRDAPWPTPPEAPPASDADPVGAVEAALAQRLDLPPEAVVAFGDADEAYRAALGIVLPSDGRDEVIVPSLYAERAAAVARAAGWRLVPGDLEADTGALSARGLARAAGERVGLAVATHPFGHPATMTELHRMVQDRQIPIVEDLTGALGASLRGVPAGRLAHAAVFTGRPGHPVTRGAFAIFPTAKAASHVRANRTSALAESDARIALAEVRRLEDELLERRRLAWELTFGLSRAKALTRMAHGRYVQHAYAAYTVGIRGILWKRSLQETVEAIRAEGVHCEVASGAPLHRDPEVLAALSGDVRVEDDVFPVANRLPGETIAIPLHSGLTSKDMDLAAAVLRKVEARSI